MIFVLAPLFFQQISIRAKKINISKVPTKRVRKGPTKKLTIKKKIKNCWIIKGEVKSTCARTMQISFTFDSAKNQVNCPAKLCEGGTSIRKPKDEKRKPRDQLENVKFVIQKSNISFQKVMLAKVHCGYFNGNDPCLSFDGPCLLLCRFCHKPDFKIIHPRS